MQFALCFVFTTIIHHLQPQLLTATFSLYIVTKTDLERLIHRQHKCTAQTVEIQFVAFNYSLVLKIQSEQITPAIWANWKQITPSTFFKPSTPKNGSFNLSENTSFDSLLPKNYWQKIVLLNALNLFVELFFNDISWKIFLKNLFIMWELTEVRIYRKY